MHTQIKLFLLFHSNCFSPTHQTGFLDVFLDVVDVVDYGKNSGLIMLQLGVVFVVSYEDSIDVHILSCKHAALHQLQILVSDLVC